MSIAMSAEASQAGSFDQPAVRSHSDTDRHFGVAIHLSPLVAFLFGPAILAPLVLWLIRKDESPFVDDHGREMLNALLSFVVYHIVAVLTVVGIVALPVLYIVAVVNLVRGAVSANRGDFFRYPMTIRFL